jgi:SPP1 gp7 family putative phage head morphogenesis protein
MSIEVLKMPNNQEYWRQRLEILHNALLNKGVNYINDLDNQYKIASNEIEKEISRWYQRFANNNQITMNEARKLLTISQLKEFRWNVTEYIKYGRENALNQQWMKELENASIRVHVSRLQALKLQLQQQIEVLYGNQTDGVDALLREIYTDGYFHTAYEIQRGFNIGWDLHSFNKPQLDTILSKPWTLDKTSFSDRIWKNKQELLGSVQTKLTQNLITGKSPQASIKALAKEFEVSNYKAGRLIMTESAAFASKSQQDCYNNLGVEKYELVATLDNNTSQICQDIDGHVFDMKDYIVGTTAPPFHPWCRTAPVPYFDDNFGERAARGADGKTYYVDSRMSYNEWFKRSVK